MEENSKWIDEMKAYSFQASGKPEADVPEGYFEAFPDRMLKRWNASNEDIVPLRISIRRMIATAAIVSGLCLGVTIWSNRSASAGYGNEISALEAYQYINEHVDEFEPLIISSAQLVKVEEAQSPEKADIEEYLMEELEGQSIETLF